MQTFTTLIRTAGLVVSTAFVLGATCAAEDTKPVAADKDPLPVFDNSITLSGQGNWVSGDKAAFQAQTWTSKKGLAGIEDFQLTKDLKNDVSVKSDGHLLAGSEDYLAHLNVSKNEFGSVDVGYKRFRTYYDNAGGFFLPTENTNIPLFPRDLAVDRGKFWAEAKLTLPNEPVITLRYSNELRNGTKDSTMWGASDYTGLTGTYYIPASAAAFNNNSSPTATNISRFIVPSYLQLGERQQNLEANIKHTIGNTTVEVDYLGNRVNNLDTHFFDRYPGEVRLPPISITKNTTTLVAPANFGRLNNEISVYDQLLNKTDTATASAKIETVISDAIKVHAGISYQHVTSDFTENRPNFTTLTYPTAAPVGFVIAPSYQALGLVGSAGIKTYTANVGADFKIGRDLFVEAGLKAEDLYGTASDTYQTQAAPAVSATGVMTAATPANIAAASRIKEKSLTPEISMRYTGVKDVSLYGTAEYKNLWGKERTIGQYNVVTGSPNALNDDVNENHGRYSIGANWVPCGFFTLRGETFYKDHLNNFQDYVSPPNFALGYKLKGAKLTATVKPIPTLSFTTRYVYQTGTMQTSGNSPSGTFADYQSMDAKIHNLGETIDWTPIKQFYAQANLNIVFDTTSTAYPRAGAGTATEGGNDIMRNADNNYYTGSVVAGFVVDKATNAELQYSFYKADNYVSTLITTGLPYGASGKEYTVTVGLKRKLTDKLVAEVKLGYLSSKNDTTGGRTNYNGRIAYVSLQQAF